ncbi:glycosylphosphatidylinositol anchor biosynthesis [Trapelia coarctata]|nr:glycosylphosphatidylinositol anchor biosynthesis [Trapelia coarctata]
MRLPLPFLLSLALLLTPTLPTHTSNWAVLISTSRFWFNYRHLANVLSLYRTVKRLGIPDSQILLLLPDDMACNPRNTFPGSIFNNAARQLDLYGSNIEVDYRGYEVTVENFIRLLTDRLGDEVPRGKRLGSDAGSNLLIYMTGHGGKEFLKFQDAEEIGSWDLADAFEQMWEKNRYREMLFMIDTCQANTMYSRFYSPNIIATGSSALDQSSYSHHADNDVGVAVIDRYTYYNLEFLEERVPDVGSRVTVGELFDSYDEAKIHSQAGVRWDLFEGGEEEGRKRLVMDFFGNVQGVEVEEGGGYGGNESEWREDMRLLEDIWRQGKEMEKEMERGKEKERQPANTTADTAVRPHIGTWGAAKVDASTSWLQRLTGAGALLGCALIWGVASWMEKPR